MLIGLFLFSSCKDANTIGLAPDGDAISGDLYDNTILSSRTQLDEAVSGSTLVRYPLGVMHDSVFGDTEAGTAMTVNIPSVAYRFGKNVVVDSAVLVMPYANSFYGDSTQKYTFTVKQLAVDLTEQTSFLTSIPWGTKTSVVLGQRVEKAQYPNTKFKVMNIVTGKPDTAVTVAPQIRINLDPTMILNKIVNLDTNVYARNDLFINKFNGLYVSVTQKTPTAAGAMAFFNFATNTDVNNGAKLQIYYRKDGLSAGTKDTVSAIFPIDNLTSPVVAEVKHNYANTPVKTQLDNAPTSPENTYVQGLSGLKNKISFDFSGFKTLLGGSKVSINKAELIVYLAPEDDTYFKPAQRLVLYRKNAAGFTVNLPDNDPASSSNPGGDTRPTTSTQLFGGYFDSVNRRYIFSVTGYVQDLVNGKIQDYGTFIAPTPLTEFNLNPFATTAERSILLPPLKDAPVGTKRMKLNIFYTKVK